MEILSHGIGETRSERVSASKLVSESCRFTRPNNWLPGITLVMAQVLKKHRKLAVQVVPAVVGDFIIKKWKRQGICLWPEDVFLNTSRQNWIGRSQPSQVPQQDSVHNNFQKALACGQYLLLRLMYQSETGTWIWTNRSTMQGHVDGWQLWAR